MTTQTVDAARQEARPGGAAGLFWRYWSASTVSQVGDAVSTVALPLVAVVTLHATAFQVSLITAARYLAWLLIGLPAGVLVQRLPLRGTQVAMDLARGAAVASVPLAAGLGVLRLPQLVAVALVIGLASVVFDVGNATFLPSIVPKGELTARNSLTSASNAATQLAGPSLGGVLVQLLGGAASMLVDAVSYLASAALLRSLPRAPHPGGAAPGGLRAQIREGWRYVVRHPVIGPCAAVATAINFVCGGLMALTPVHLVRTLGAPSAVVGVLLATGGLGSLLGATLTPRLVARFGNGAALRGSALLSGCAAFLLPAAGAGWATLLFAVGNSGFFAGVVVTSVVTRTHRQAAAPPELLARVMATVRFVSWGIIPVGALAAGAAAAQWGTRTALWLLAVGSIASPSILYASPVRRLRELA
ncbi:MFS transporter [Kitasatospora sp. LaBMicrA B282]|uniref:MFS transporter n=1 Tax=Kitasatospora sp. LaBMicrA B282 TaxID=3420949 RepID=UPI003D12887F